MPSSRTQPNLEDGDHRTIRVIVVFLRRFVIALKEFYTDELTKAREICHSIYQESTFVEYQSDCQLQEAVAVQGMRVRSGDPLFLRVDSSHE